MKKSFAAVFFCYLLGYSNIGLAKQGVTLSGYIHKVGSTLVLETKQQDRYWLKVSAHLKGVYNSYKNHPFEVKGMVKQGTNQGEFKGLLQVWNLRPLNPYQFDKQKTYRSQSLNN